ncbi:hypothetical protein CJF30_00005990 [Rutstroemia sp. NJR-2017a BBW]|nr:hypothetical protein CJF30_00005990 [Rutstroemia sp. NJR-2017a BBW]
MPPTQHLLHALEILSVFLCAHHFWPKGITYSEKEAWERPRSKPKSSRRRRRTRDASRSRAGSEEVFVPRGIYRGDGSEFFPEVQVQEQERHVGRSESRRGGGESDAGSGQGRNYRKEREELGRRYRDYEERGEDEG